MNWFVLQEVKKRKQKFTSGEHIQSLMHVCVLVHMSVYQIDISCEEWFIYTLGVFNIVYRSFFSNISIGRMSQAEPVPQDQS